MKQATQPATKTPAVTVDNQSSPQDQKLLAFVSDLGIPDLSLVIVKQAFTHKSTLAHRELRRLCAEGSYERLEFLGDSILNAAITDRIFHAQEQFSEGELSRIRSKLIDESNLAEIAREFGFGEHLLMSPGEIRAGGKNKPSILADVVESVIGAVFLQLGFTAAAKLIDQLFEKNFQKPLKSYLSSDYKSQLQEYTQARFKDRPEYIVENHEGPDHCITFEVAVNFRGKTLGRGNGTSKKKASQEAAMNALNTIKQTNDLMQPNQQEAAHD